MFYRDLHNHKNQPRPSLALDDLLSSLSIRGGHCYQVGETICPITDSTPQHSELLYAALISLGYSVTRVGSWVLNGKELRSLLINTFRNYVITSLTTWYQSSFHNTSTRQEMQKTHNILLVTIGSERFLVDTGFGPRSPRLSFFFHLLLFLLSDPLCTKLRFSPPPPHSPSPKATFANFSWFWCTLLFIYSLSRYPLCFSFAGTAEVECCEGER